MDVNSTCPKWRWPVTLGGGIKMENDFFFPCNTCYGSAL